MGVLSFEGILKPEAMLRQAQAEVNALKARVQQLQEVVRRLEGQIHTSTLSFCAVAVQAGGEVTISRDEVTADYNLQRREDPATHAVTWKVERQTMGSQASPVQ